MDKPKRSASESPEEQPRKVQRTGDSSSDESESVAQASGSTSNAEEVALESGNQSGNESVSGEQIGGQSIGSRSGEESGELPPTDDESSGSDSSGSSGQQALFVVNTGDDSYRAEKLLGCGTFGTVYGAVRRSDNELVSIKVLDHTKVEEGNREHEVNMANFTMQYPHRNVMQFTHTHVTASHTFLIGEYSEIGDIFAAMQIDNGFGERIWVQFDENLTRYITVGIASGLQHMHGLGIAHGDLKLQNVLLFQNPGAEQYPEHPSITAINRCAAKLCDFSNSQIGDNPNEPIMRDEPLCAVAYAAPESYEGIEYDCIRADVFSLGCCLIAMIMGAVPFGHPIQAPQPQARSPTSSNSDSVGSADSEEAAVYRQKVFTFVNKAKYDVGFKARLFKICSYPLRNLLEGMLEADPQTRITLDQFFAHEWVTRPKLREFEDVSHKVSELETHPLFPDLQIKTYAEH